MARSKIPTLAELLIEDGCDRELVEHAAREFYDIQFGQHLVSAGVATEAQVSKALARQAAKRRDPETAFRHAQAIGVAAHAVAMAWVTGGGKP